MFSLTTLALILIGAFVYALVGCLLALVFVDESDKHAKLAKYAIMFLWPLLAVVACIFCLVYLVFDCLRNILMEN